MKFLQSLLLEFNDELNCLRCGGELETKADFETGVCAECWDPDFDGDYEGYGRDDMIEVVYVDPKTNKILSEAAVRMFKRKDKEIKRMYRCTTGPKKGKPVSDPKLCATRKDPKKVRHGRKVARTKKGIRVRKSKIAKRTAMSKTVRRMNQRLKGARVTKNTGGTAKTPTNTNTKSTVQPKKIKGLQKPQKPKKVG